MATKTFKIGLSNTDKTNMAQDVYERLIAMCFDEYDSSETYNAGDFVVYENPSDTFNLYKCNADNTTGAWDGSKWDLATFQDLVDDVEDAVDSVAQKANVNGNYPTMTVGLADDLTPYDDTSGDDQDEPFSFQATGTANGTQPDFATGSKALLKEKQGNSVVVNQYVSNNTFTSTTGWTAYQASLSVANNTATITGNGNAGYMTLYQTPVTPITVGHKFLVFATVNCSQNRWQFNINGVHTSPYYTNGTSYWVIEVTNGNTSRFAIYPEQTNGTAGATAAIKNFNVIDITQWFGSNDAIPQDLLDNPDNWSRYYQGSLAYNTGTFVDANSQYIKAWGTNQWDEEWELGAIDTSTGENTTNNNRIRSKNYCKIIPNLDYHIYSPYSVRLYLYDANKVFTRALSDANNSDYFTVAPNEMYFRVQCTNGNQTTYNHDISLYIVFWNDPSDHSQGMDGDYYNSYTPYELLTNNDTGTEVLRSAGSVRDYKTPDGTIHRLVGIVDLGACIWTYQSSSTRFWTNGIQALVKRPASNVVANLKCKLYIANTDAQVYYSANDKQMAIGESGTLFIQNSSYTDADTFKTAMSGVYLYYELATPTTEQGTPFSENIDIEDTGAMDFSGTSGIPQGALIFYPVSYKAFDDTLYKYVNGTPSNLAKKSDLPTSPDTYLTSLTGYDATKTQTLKNVEGTLTWVDDE